MVLVAGIEQSILKEGKILLLQVRLPRFAYTESYTTSSA